MKIKRDFVTNSSSACFVVNYYDFGHKDFTIKKVEEDFQKMLDFYNMLFNDDVTMEKAIENIFIFSESDLPQGKDKEYAWEYERPETIGKIVIIGQSNEIPYALFSLIEQHFNATHFHLG